MRRCIPLLLAGSPLLAGCQQPMVPSVSEVLPIMAVETPLPSLPVLIDSLSIPLDSVRLVVRKAARMLMVVAQGDTLKRYPCVLGEVPEGDKRMEGDRRTPEGTFTFRDKYPHREWHKFAWIDYPNTESWQRFRQRKRNGLIPAHATIGGEIGIHGVPAGMDQWITMGSDWTWGCIALRNADLDEIWPYLRPRHTWLLITP